MTADTDARQVELIRDYVGPDGRVFRVTAKVAPEMLSWPLGRAMIEKDIEQVRDIKMKRLTP